MMRGNGGHPIVSFADEKQYSDLLKKKLVEEVEEFLGSGDLEELVDVLEVIRAIVTDLGSNQRIIERMRELKELTNGSFSRGIIWHGNESSD